MDDRLWIDRALCCRLLGRSDEFLRCQIEPGIAAEHKRRRAGRGRAWELWAPAIVAAFVRYESSGVGAESDPGMVAGDSPALEEYRKWRAKSAELDYWKQYGRVVEVEKLGELLQRIANRLQRCGERLAVRWGPEAQQLLNEAISDCERSIDSIGELGRGDGQGVRPEDASGVAIADRPNDVPLG